MYKYFLLGFFTLFTASLANAQACDNAKITIQNVSAHSLEVSTVNSKNISGIADGLIIGCGEQISATIGDSDDIDKTSITLKTDDGETIQFTTFFRQHSNAGICIGRIPACPGFLKISNKEKYTVASDVQNGNPAEVTFYVLDMQ